MKVINSIIIAFAMYSRIPMPKASWTKENMRYVMCAFPFVGVLIGALCYVWLQLSCFSNIGTLLSTVVFVLLPIWLTGGIHIDGFMDTWDALGSWREKEKRLEILKDSHVGAMAVIHLCSLLLVEVGIWSALEKEQILPLCFGFFLSRVSSAFAVASFPMAKSTGLASTFQSAADKAVTRMVLGIEFLIGAGTLVYLWPFYGGLMVIAMLALFGYYYGMSKKYFGGITGDLAGWYLSLCECLMAAVVVLGATIHPLL